MTTFACPRCHSSVDESFYGPCLTCRTALRSHYAGLARAVEEQKFEPAMHVTPNQVATKD
jgi:hypothetical protein